MILPRLPVYMTGPARRRSIESVMTHYLKHHFNPDLDPGRLHPRVKADGSVDHHDLEYVQNVVKGQVLAAFVSAEQVQGSPVRELSQRRLPAGPGTRVHPERDDLLLADKNGHVSYRDNLIVVQDTVTVPADVDYSTGNITFVGALRVQGAVRSGFQVSADRVRVAGLTEGASVTAVSDVRLDGGIKGNGRANIHGRQDVLAGFCENALIKAGRDIKIRSSCLHSRLFAGHRVLVKQRLIGGECHAFNGVLVGEQLGGGLSSETVVSLGYDPSLMLAVRQVEKGLDSLREKLPGLKVLADRDDEAGREYAQKLERGETVYRRLKERRLHLWELIERTARLEDCALEVRGSVRPGVVVHIGPASLKVDDYLENVRFVLDGHEIRVDSPGV